MRNAFKPHHHKYYCHSERAQQVEKLLSFRASTASRGTKQSAAPSRYTPMKTHYPNITILLIFLLLSSCKFFQPVDQDAKPDTTTEESTSTTPTAPLPGNAQFDYWIHQPLHPKNNEAITFKTSIKEPSGIATIELHLYEYELFLNDDELPSKKKRDGGQWGKVNSWNGNGLQEQTISFDYNNGFPSASQVEYLFKVTDNNGKVTERLAAFDAGTSPWPTDKILLYRASRADLSQTFNLCLFPDTDFEGNWGSFLEDSHKMIFDGFHQSNVMNDRKERWTFYYTQQEADGLKIAQEFDDPQYYPDFMKGEIITGIDAFALLHKRPYSDGSYLYGNIHFLAQNVFTTESYNLGTAIHEMGHSVFQLSDEYNGCACFQPTEGFSNVFETEKACLEFQKSQGLSHQHCHRIVALNSKRWYTPERNVYFPTEQACFDFNKANGFTEANCITFIDTDGSRTYRAEEGLCIMNDDGDDKIYPFQEACIAVVEDYYSRFGKESLASGGGPAVVRENMYGYEPVVYLTLAETNGFWSANVEKIDFGIPNKKNRKGNGAVLNFVTNNNNTNYRLQIDRPGEGHFCGGNTNTPKKESGAAKCMITVPYTEDLTEVVIENRLVMKNQTIKGSGVQRINLQMGLEAALKQFEKEK